MSVLLRPNSLGQAMSEKVTRLSSATITALALWLLLFVSGDSAAANNASEGKIVEELQLFRDTDKKIVSSLLSPDGAWVAYTVASTTNAELIVRSVNRPREYKFPRDPLLRPEAATDWKVHVQGELERLWITEFTNDSQFLVYTTGDREKSLSGTTKGQVKLHIVRLDDGFKRTINEVNAFRISSARSGYIAYTINGLPEATHDRNDDGQDLILQSLIGDRGSMIAKDVSVFDFDSTGDRLIFSAKDPLTGLVNVSMLQLDDRRVGALAHGLEEVASLRFSPQANRLAFVASSKKNGQIIYYGDLVSRSFSPVVRSLDIGPEVRIDAKRLEFTGSGSRLVFSWTDDAEKIPNSEIEAEILHWKDAAPRNKPSSRSVRPGDPYTSVYDIERKRVTRLTDRKYPKVFLSASGNIAVSYREWSHLSSRVGIWDPYPTVVSLRVMSLREGEVLLEKDVNPTYVLQSRSPIIISPDDRFLLYINNRNQRWNSLELATGRTIDLVGDLSLKYQFATSRPYEDRGCLIEGCGIAAWTASGMVLLYDQNDIWKVDPAGVTPAVNITKVARGDEDIAFRLPEHQGSTYSGWRILTHDLETTIDGDGAFLVTAFNRDNMSSGLWGMSLNPSFEPRRIAADDRFILPIFWNNKHKKVLYSSEDFSEKPTLWYVSWKSDSPENFQISHAHAEKVASQENYSGIAELVAYQSEDGFPLKGVLLKPESYREGNTYPLVVEIYEQQSPSLHQYQNLEPSTTTINPRVLLANGYLVFRPDVRSARRAPGASAVASLTPVIERMIEDRVADRVALIGHSFGAYETAYILTQTSTFSCGIASSGNYNLLSAYSSAAVGPMYFERSQGRMVDSLLVAPYRYMENSPLLYAERVEVPVLLAHNENDRVVPFSQGLEFFTALKRYGKESYLINYPSEGHSLVKYTNRLDWEQRTLGFLNYCLKDADPAAWMKVPYETTTR